MWLRLGEVLFDDQRQKQTRTAAELEPGRIEVPNLS
jgi:hypothetical protein